MLMQSDILLTRGVAAIFGLGNLEILLIVLAILLLFGGAKLPELARGLGRAMRILRDEVKGISAATGDDDAKPIEKADSKNPYRDDTGKNEK